MKVGVSNDICQRSVPCLAVYSAGSSENRATGTAAMNKERWLHLILLIAIPAAVAGFYLYNARVQPPPPLTAEERQMNDELFAATKTQCVGRYLFKVPATLTNTHTDGVNINQALISSKRLYAPAFAQRIRLREAELLNTKTVNPKHSPFLKQVYRINEHAVIFDRNENQSTPGYARVLEGHLYANGVAFTLTLEMNDFSDPHYEENRQRLINAGVSDWGLNTKQRKLAEMQSLLSRITDRTNEEIPTRPGTCIPEGFIADGEALVREDMTFVYPHDTFSLSVSTNNHLGDKTSMLERNAEIMPYVIAANGRTLRKGKTRIAGYETDEWLIMAHPEDNAGNATTQLMFLAINNEKKRRF